MTNKNDSAYPITEQQNDYGFMQGLTKRELISAMCLQGILSNTKLSEEWGCVVTIKQAIAHADALIDELNKGEK